MLQQHRTAPILGPRYFLLAACIWATAVNAQQVPAPETSGKRSHSLLEEVVVTAQKRQQSANDVAIAISAFTGEQLEALGISDTRDLSALVPGFIYADSGFNTPTYTLRGVGFNEASQTASSTVGVYLDEFNLPFPVMTKGANLDLARVEVLKGPQGTLYGRNTTGGAINYIAEKPSENFEASVEAGYSSFKTYQLSGMLSGPLADGLRGRLALQGIQSDRGWQRSLTRPGDKLGRKDKLSGRGILEWDLNDSLRMRLSVDSWRDNSEPQAPQAVYIRPQNPILGELGLSPEVSGHPLVSPNTDDAKIADWPARPPLDRSFRLNDQFDMVSFRLDQDLFDNTSFTLLASSARFESDGSVIPQSGTSVEYLTDRIIDVDTKAHQVEARFSGTLGADINWVSGVFYSLDEVSEYQDYFTGKVSAVFPTPLGPTIADRLVLLGEQEAETQAVFGNIDWPLSANMTLSAGARYTREVREFTGCSADSPGRSQGVGFGPVFTAIGATNIDSLDDLLGLLDSLSDGSVVDNVNGNGGCFTANVETAQPGLARPPELDEDNISGRLALDWSPYDGTLVYTSYSRGYKSGSFPVLSSSRSDQYEPATQERLDVSVHSKT